RRAEARVVVSPSAGGGCEKRGVGAGDEDRVKAPGPVLLVQRPVDIGAERADQGFIAEPVHNWGDVVDALAGGTEGVVEVHPAGDLNFAVRVFTEEQAL